MRWFLFLVVAGISWAARLLAEGVVEDPAGSALLAVSCLLIGGALTGLVDPMSRGLLPSNVLRGGSGPSALSRLIHIDVTRAALAEAQAGTVIPTEITIYEDRSFDFILKTPPTSTLIREKAGLDKAANNQGAEVVGSITEAQLEEIATIKMPDLNAYDLEAAKLQVRGTARSMGIEVVD